ncbi:MAG: glycosyltransferase family 4 protein [Candidatus Omnitrophota bacterium]|nr:glycosyltransferase family 4 protein [Candidatus Omnitrophota bacterium]
MRVLQVTTHMDMGGIANYIITLSESLNDKGAFCVVASSGGELEGEMEKRGILHRKLNIRTKSELAPKVLWSIFKLVGIVRDEGIDVIHAHTRVSQVAAFFASRITGVPYVTTCHGFFKKRMRKVFDTWGSKAIAISDAVALHLRDDLGVRDCRIALIYNGVDCGRFAKEYSAAEINEIKRRLGLEGQSVIGTIGRLSPVKGQKYLIEALASLVSMRRDVRLLIAGDGPEESALKELVKSLGLESIVRFAGSIIDTRGLLAIMDVFVFPSVKEGLGMALLEALASGKACVASNVGGIGNVIENGSNGILVPIGDSAAIAGAVSRLLDNPELRRKMGDSGRAVVREKFSLDSMTDKMIGVYKEVLR